MNTTTKKEVFLAHLKEYLKAPRTEKSKILDGLQMVTDIHRKVGGFFKVRRGRKGLSATTPSALKRLIPIFTGPWQDKPPGFGQVDTVVHCGSSLLGDMAHTLNYVEERNGHVIRKVVGYRRFDCPEAVDALNELYDVLTPYLMHFVAVRRTLEKEKIQSKYRRTYEQKPKTPYQRVLEHPLIDESVKEKLRKEHKTLNPLAMKHEIEKRLERVYAVQKRHGKPNI